MSWWWIDFNDFTWAEVRNLGLLTWDDARQTVYNLSDCKNHVTYKWCSTHKKALFVSVSTWQRKRKILKELLCRIHSDEELTLLTVEICLSKICMEINKSFNFIPFLISPQLLLFEWTFEDASRLQRFLTNHSVIILNSLFAFLSFLVLGAQPCLNSIGSRNWRISIILTFHYSDAVFLRATSVEPFPWR